LGRPDEALDRLRNAWRLSPFDPLSFFFWGVAGFAEFLAGRYDEALVWLGEALWGPPRPFAPPRNPGGCPAHPGPPDQGQAAAEELLACEPTFRVSVFESKYPLRRPGDLERLVSGLRAAGLPE